MNEILTNEEIETLLQMFRTEGGASDVETNKAGAVLSSAAFSERVVSPADLLKPNRLSREQLLA
ncbi:MAG TPA: hypothetical protein VK348_02155, partial [Planctomycetota bacterium]|nr:hypothetical protein [Planctomycetota bacterium]